MQDDYRVGVDWGLAGARQAVRSGASIAVVVDVLSFSTAASVGCDRGIEVFPFAWRDDRAGEYARSLGAMLARGRRHGGVSLSPASIRASTGVSRLVLPSPNGASISAALADAGLSVVAGCLRNAAAVATWLADQLEAGHRAAVVAAGERWPDDSLRPAVEDLWGAGAIVAELDQRLPASGVSPEAGAAAAAFMAVRADVPGQLAACVSGRELVGYGFAEDVGIAAELNSSMLVPLLQQGCFRPA